MWINIINFLILLLYGCWILQLVIKIPDIYLLCNVLQDKSFSS